MIVRHTVRDWSSLVAAFVVIASLSGCGSSDGPELSTVDGYVYLDGEPLPNAIVIFKPEGGAPSYGATDAKGYYTLGYSASKQGAMIGRHRVEISTFRAPDVDEEGNPTPGAPEKLPVEYNRQSTLTAEVKSGRNTIDFKELKSEGNIVQPKVVDE